MVNTTYKETVVPSSELYKVIREATKIGAEIEFREITIGGVVHGEVVCSKRGYSMAKLCMHELDVVHFIRTFIYKVT